MMRDGRYTWLGFPFCIAKTNHPFYYTSKVEGKWEFQRITDKEVDVNIGLSGITALQATVQLRY